jgi:hypothetical protein
MLSWNDRETSGENLLARFEEGQDLSPPPLFRVKVSHLFGLFDMSSLSLILVKVVACSTLC